MTSDPNTCVIVLDGDPSTCVMVLDESGYVLVCICVIMPGSWYL